MSKNVTWISGTALAALALWLAILAVPMHWPYEVDWDWFRRNVWIAHVINGIAPFVVIGFLLGRRAK